MKANRRLPWLMHLFGVMPWDLERLELADFDELCALVDMWLENGGRWQRTAQQEGG